MMFRQIALLSVSLALLATGYTAGSEDEEKRMFEPSEPPDLELSITINDTGDALSFSAKNTSKSDIEVLTFGMGSNYLLVQDASGRVTRQANYRRGKYTTLTIPAGATSLMRRMRLAEFVSSYLPEETGKASSFRVLWVIDLFEGRERKARYTSNVLVVSRNAKAE